jgi:hypothetical protein
LQLTSDAQEYLHALTSRNREEPHDYDPVEPGKATNWVRVCLALVERALDSRPRKRTSTKPHNAPDQLAMLLKHLRLSPEVCKFYQERRRTFDERNIARLTRKAAAAGQSYSVPAE